MNTRTVVGLIGPVCVLQCRSKWNAYLRQQGSDLDFQYYRTRTREELELRLSEMFVLERRGYIVHPEFITLVLPLLDRLDDSAAISKKVDTIVNDGGRLIGYFFDADVNGAMDARCRLWGGGTREYIA
ncbi:MAG: hypothetical protein ABL890_02210 [Candidatus Peribacteraceae bacterium]